MTDIDVFVTDCGADVQSAARILGISAFPCLAHVINLIVKQFTFNTCTLEDDDNVESDSEEHAISDHEYNETIKVMRAAVRKIKRLSSVHDRFITVQTAIRGLSDPPPDSNCKQPKDFLEIVVDNSTRWNSLYDCIERFLFLRKTIEATLDAEDLSGINWDKLLEIAQILKPLKVSDLKFYFKQDAR